MTPVVVGLSSVATALLLVTLFLWRRERQLRIAVMRAIAALDAPPPPTPDLSYRLERAVGNVGARLDGVESRQKHYLDAINGSEFGVLIADAGGRAVLVNPQAARYTEAREGHPVTEVRFRDMLDAVVRSGEIQHREFDVYTPERRVVRLDAVPIHAAGAVEGVVLYIQDLTERRRVDQMHEDFVANVSHELKTPLGALSVLAETIGDTEDPAAQRKLTDRLQDEAKRMAHLVDDILNLTHLESTEVGRMPIKVVEVLDEAHHRVAITADELGIELNGSPPAEEVMVIGDQRELVSAVVNLLDNAIKYTDVADRHHRSVRWRGYTEDGMVVIEVADDGVGIPQAHLGRIFERFFRVDRARSRDTGGTGLGLPIARRVALKHGGDITVESELGTGSTFRLHIPQLLEEGHMSC